MDDVLSDIFGDCLARLDANATVEDCLAAYPQQRATLEGPLRLAASLRALPSAAPLAPTARSTITTNVLAQVVLQRSATNGSARSTRAQPASRAFDPSAMLAGVLRALGYRGPLSHTWLRLASAAIALVLALILSAGALAAARAVIRAIASPQPTTVPASTMPTFVPAESFALDGAIGQIAPDGWLVNGMLIAVDADTTVNGAAAVGAVAHVRGMLQDNGTLLARSIMVDAAPAAAAVPAEPAPAANGELFTQLRALLVAGVADGRAGEDGNDLIAKFDEAQAAFAGGDLQKAAEKLRDLRQKIQEQAGEGKMEANFSGQALAQIDMIAGAYGLNMASDGPGKDDKGKNDNGKNDKGKNGKGKNK